MDQSITEPELDILKNVIPDKVKSVHLIAICGTGMGALAGVLHSLGYQVTGSDQNVYPPMSDFLADKGIKVFQGYREENLSHGPDLVVVGNAVSRNNPEVQKMIGMDLNFCSMPQALNSFLVRDKKVILVTGTHGKTTTSSLMAWVLEVAGLDPSYMIGGIVENFGSNYRIGKGEYIVIEGDEYDTAFFDKGPKFFHYTPHSAILTSVEFDHADIYRDLKHVVETFDRFVSDIPEQNSVFAFDSDENIQNIVKEKKCIVERYGKGKNSFWRIENGKISHPWSEFTVFKNGKSLADFRTKLIGEHNRLNALAVIGVADRLGISPDKISQALETFKSVKRRQEVRGEKNGVLVIDDFAHHPSAVTETIKAVKSFYTDRRVVAVFEPRTNTSMRSVFQEIYPEALKGADMICVRKPPLLSKIPEDNRFSSEQLTEDLKKLGKESYFFEETGDIVDFLCEITKPGDLLLVMSNGGFDNIHERLLKSL